MCVTPFPTHSTSWEPLASPCKWAQAQLAALLPARSREPRAHSWSCSRHLRPVGFQHAGAHPATKLLAAEWKEPALAKVTRNRGGSYSIPFLKGEEHLLIPAPIALCYKHLVQLLSAVQGGFRAWLPGELRVGSASFPDQGSREGQDRTVAFWVNGKERTGLVGKQRIAVVSRTLQQNEVS